MPWRERLIVVACLMVGPLVAVPIAWLVELHTARLRFERSGSTTCSSYLKNTWLQIESWRQFHGGRYPESLAQCCGAKHEGLLACPFRSRREGLGYVRDRTGSDYGYAAPAPSAGLPASLIPLVWDLHGNHHDGSGCVLYADGSVRWMGKEAFEGSGLPGTAPPTGRPGH
jgi:hypothetical protein